MCWRSSLLLKRILDNFQVDSFNSIRSYGCESPAPDSHGIFCNKFIAGNPILSKKRIGLFQLRNLFILRYENLFINFHFCFLFIMNHLVTLNHNHFILFYASFSFHTKIIFDYPYSTLISPFNSN